MSAQPASLVDIRAMLTQMLGNANDLVRMSSQLVRRVQELPPDRSEMLSRVRFDRAACLSLVANFFDAPEDVPRTQNIRMPDDVWIRGVNIIALPAIYFAQTPSAADWLQSAEQRALLCRYGSLWRGLIDVDWRIPSQQGFIQDGYSDLMASAAAVSGDGEWSVDLDWQLQREDQIIVRVTNRINRMLDPECDTNITRALTWVAVVFWAEPKT